MLTDEQIAHFRTFGFLILRGFFSEEELQIIKGEFELRLSTTKRFASPDDAPTYVSWPNLGPETPVLASLLEDLRIGGIIEQLLGDDVIGISCNAGVYVNETTWHPDNSDLHMHSIRVAIYLQPLAAHNGALRLIPGSHQNPLHDAVRKIIQSPGHRVDEVPAYVCQSEPGDVVLFDQRAWHASSGGSTDRRMIGMQYYKNPATDEEKQAAKQVAVSDREIRVQLAQNTFDTPVPEYHPHWVANPENSPKRQRWINWLREWGYIRDAESEGR